MWPFDQITDTLGQAIANGADSLGVDLSGDVSLNSDGTLNATGTGVDVVGDKSGELIGQTGEYIDDVASEVETGVEDVFTGVKDATDKILSTGPTLVEAVREQVGRAYDFVQGEGQDIISGLRNAENQVVGGIQDFTSASSNALNDVYSGITRPINDGLDSVENTTGNIASVARSVAIIGVLLFAGGVIYFWSKSKKGGVTRAFRRTTGHLQRAGRGIGKAALI